MNLNIMRKGFHQRGEELAWREMIKNYICILREVLGKGERAPEAPRHQIVLFCFVSDYVSF